MSIYIESFLIVVLEILCCKIFFETFAEKRDENNHIKNYGIIAGVILASYFIAMLFNNYLVLKEIILIMIIAILMMTYLNIKLWKSIIFSVIFNGIVLVIDYFSLLLCITIFDSVLKIEMSYHVQGSLLVILGKVFLFLVVLLLRKKYGHDSTLILLDAEWLRFIFFPVFTICTITAIIVTTGNMKNQKLETVYFAIAFSLAGMNLVMFYLINDILKRELKLRESQLFQLQVKNQTNMYHTISENFAKQRKKTHEYKNQIVCIESLIKKKEFDELAEYVRELSGDLSKELDYISTNNVIVDAILNAKYHEIIENSILFVFKINDLSGIYINDQDIVIILSNLLNNAIEACVQCKNEKKIKLKFIHEDDSIIISVKNTYENRIICDGGEIISSKEDNTEEHGIGIKNIIETIKKYDGSYVIQQSEREFYFSIIIPCQKK